jgi:hypothetical protein
MKTSYVGALFIIGFLWDTVAFPEGGRADNIVIEATADNTWMADSSQSSGNTPLIVQAKKGDVLEISVTGGQHGFVTLDKKGKEPPSEAPKFVLACGETPQSKPDAVFRELECSRFGKPLLANMKLEVLDKFQSDVHFWCIIHQDQMWGSIRPRP